MAEIRCARIKLKPGSLDRVHDWAQELSNRQDEVLEALAAEGVTMEMAFLEQAADGDYLIYIMKADKLAKADQVTDASERPIDAYHQAFKDATFESGKKLEQLIYFER